MSQRSQRMLDTGLVGATVQTGARAPLGNGHLLLWQHLIQCIVEARVLLFDAAHDAAHHGGLHLALSADILVESEADGSRNALSGTIVAQERLARVRPWRLTS